MNYQVILGTAVVLGAIIVTLKLISLLFKKPHTAKARRVWLILHIVAVIVYIGGMITQTWLHSFADKDPANYMIYYDLMNMFDHCMIIPGAFSCVITGTWLAVRGGWGLTKQRWIIWKWLGNCLGILLGIMLVGQALSRRFLPFINSGYDVNMAGFAEVNRNLYIGQFICLAVLLFLVFISYIRPKNKAAK